jgi:hypothetical protein
MTDDTCESHSCTKRFYKYSGDPVITSIDLTQKGQSITMSSTANPQAMKAVKAAVEKRKTSGKIIKSCPKDIKGCICKPLAEAPAGADWSVAKTVKYKVVVPDFKVLSGDPPEVAATVHFTVQEQHFDVTTSCEIDEEELGFAFTVDEAGILVLSSVEVTSLAASVNQTRNLTGVGEGADPLLAAQQSGCTGCG